MRDGSQHTCSCWRPTVIVWSASLLFKQPGIVLLPVNWAGAAALELIISCNSVGSGIVSNGVSLFFLYPFGTVPVDVMT